MLWNGREHCRPICVMFNRLRSMYLFLVETKKTSVFGKKGGFYERKIIYVATVIENCSKNMMVVKEKNDNDGR